MQVTINIKLDLLIIEKEGEQRVYKLSEIHYYHEVHEFISPENPEVSRVAYNLGRVR